MLEPDDRQLLVDALRPPSGYELDQAVATTFTLDLDALLVAPLAFALYDWATDAEGRPDPLALLEALRRHAQRTTVFCQAGEIGFRNNYRPLVVLVEGSVVPVVPPAPGAIFHPKLWLLRFIDGDGGIRHRLLVPSRNLTFDRSWDSLLVLDGEPADAPVDETVALADMIATLPDLATGALDPRRAAEVRALAAELRLVSFTPPEGFDRVIFHPIGLGASWPLRERYDRALVISPFLTSGALKHITKTGTDHALVSSPDAMTVVGRAGLDGFRDTFVLTPGALPPEAGEAPITQPEEAAASAARPELDGLHAKLFLLERGERISLYTGSANATDAAFHGNVELLVELTGQRETHGIDRLLELDDDGLGFRTLLDEYEPVVDAPLELTDHEQLGVDLDRLQRAIGQLEFTVHLEPASGSDLHATLTAIGDVPGGIDALKQLRVWPISRGAGHGTALTREGDGLRAEVGILAPDGVTAFMAIHAVLEVDQLEVETTFVVTAALIGAPSGRDQRVLTMMLRNQQELLRYLLFLLADAELDLQALIDAMSSDQFGAPSGGFDRVAPPLLETMLQSLSGDPSRLDHVNQLIEDLRGTQEGRDLLPEGLDDIWGPIWTVRQELD
jgi:hypothetical protein